MKTFINERSQPNEKQELEKHITNDDTWSVNYDCNNIMLTTLNKNRRKEVVFNKLNAHWNNKWKRINRESNTNKNNLKTDIYRARQIDCSPEMVGVSTPSLIAIQVPSKTTISSPFRNLGCLLKKFLSIELSQVSAVPSASYADKLSSTACWLGRMHNLACLQSSEYRATVPPDYNRGKGKSHQTMS